jgi:tetratricopeptide (TPR) repeat protein
LAGPFKFKSEPYNIKLTGIPDTDLTDPVAINQRGVEYYSQRQFDQALLDFNKAVQIEPNYVDAIYNRGLVYYHQGKYDQTLSDCNQVLAIDPQYAKAYYVRALAYSATKRCQFAISDLVKGIEIGNQRLGPYDSDVHWAMNHLARIQAASPEAELRDGKKAVELATKACELTSWSNPDFVDTLAAAFAETGDFESAIKWQSKAIQLSSERRSTSQGSSEERLKLYQSRKPFREATDK